MTVVYVDTLFLLNLTIDYLLLRLSARICGQYVPTLRLALGALMGAVYALCAFLPQGHFLTYPPVKVAVGVALALTAFGGRQRLLRLTLVFFACACALGGGVLMVSLLGSGVSGRELPGAVGGNALSGAVLQGVQGDLASDIDHGGSYRPSGCPGGHGQHPG